MIDDAFAALSDPTRRQVVELLGKGPQRAGELAAAVGTSAPALSRHLRVLRQAGLAQRSPDDANRRAHLYRLNREALTEVRDWLDEVELFWTDQLAAFAAHVDAP